MKKILQFTFISFLLISCASKPTKPAIKKDAYKDFVKSKEVTQDANSNKDKLKIAGYTIGKVIDKTDLDGCSFVIQIEDSTFLEPIGLDPQFQKPNLEIGFKFRQSRAMSTCMMGKPAVISEVKLIK